MAEASNQSVQIQGWIERLQAGDLTARDELIKSACARLTRLTRKMLRSYPRVKRWEQTDDVFQNSVLRLYRALAEVTPQTVGDFFRLAALNIRRELLDLAKHYYGPRGHGAKHGTSPPRTASDSKAVPAHDKQDTTREPGRLAAWSDFHEQIDALPDDEREVFDLLWYQGLTQAEAADILQVTERTIKRRWQAARLRLHEALHGEMPR